MKTRNQIIEEIGGAPVSMQDIYEVLLDIRDLLAHPLIEITQKETIYENRHH